MAASKEIYCGQCEYDNVTTPATNWCTDCSEGYCSECLRSHKAAKPSRNHHVIPISDYIQAERFSVSITCPTHKKKLDFFCRDHESILCVICVQQNHGKCDDLLNLNEASQGVKSSTALADLEQNIDGILENIEKGVHSLQENRADIKKQEKTAILAIQKIRDQINKHLDSLQEKITATLKKKCDECDKERSTLITSLAKKKDNLHGLKDNTNEMKRVASDLQAFIWIRNMLNKIRETSEEVKPLINNIQEFSIVYHSNEKARSLVESVDFFGQVQVTSKGKVSPYIEQNLVKAQGRRISVQGIDTMQLRLRQRFKLDAEALNVTSCLLLPNKKMLFVNQKKLIILDEDGSHFSNIHVIDNVFDATVIDKERVAISYNSVSNNTIAIVNLYSRQLEKKFPNCFKHWAWGISYYNERLYVIAYGEGIKEIDLNGRVLRTINLENPNNVYRATLYRDRVYYSGRDGVTCAELSGKVIWSYNDDKIKRDNDYSQGLSICSNSAVLVTGESKNIVMAISKDGKDKKILLNHSDGLNRPYAIHIDKNSLLIFNRIDGQAFLYEIIY